MDFLNLFLGASLAFLATSLGAAGVFAFSTLSKRTIGLIFAFCAGVMAFSSFEMAAQAHTLGGNAVLFGGVILGVLAFAIAERLLPHLHLALRKQTIADEKKKATMLAGTITIHNIPEGFAIASAFAGSPALGWLVASSIALQDVPEGLLASAPLACYGVKTKNSFFWGVFSGFVEAMAAVVGYLFLSIVVIATPLGLAFSAGAMAFVVVFELLPDAFKVDDKHISALLFALGIGVAAALGRVLLGV